MTAAVEEQNRAAAAEVAAAEAAPQAAGRGSRAVALVRDGAVFVALAALAALIEV